MGIYFLSISFGNFAAGIAAGHFEGGSQDAGALLAMAQSQLVAYAHDLRIICERERKKSEELARIHHVQHQHLVAPVAEVAQRLEREVAVEQEIGHEDDEAPPAEQVYDPAERRLGRRALPRLETAEHLHQLAPVAEPRAGRQHGPHLVVEGDEAGGVPLPQENEG